MKNKELISEDILEKWIVEYSPIQRSFHISTIDESLGNNLDIIFNYKSVDLPGYIPLGIHDTRDKAIEFVKIIERKLV